MRGCDQKGGQKALTRKGVFPTIMEWSLLTRGVETSGQGRQIAKLLLNLASLPHLGQRVRLCYKGRQIPAGIPRSQL